MSSDSKILVTLANSNFGTLAIDYLIKVVPPKNIVGTVRDIKKGEKLKQKGIELRVADYSKPETLLEAFKGIEKILFISSIPGQAVSRDKQHKMLLMLLRNVELNSLFIQVLLIAKIINLH